MKAIVRQFGIVGALVFVALQATPALAQATRTWVSGVGDDANPCSRTAPCKTFAGAISKTAASGIINCLDPGGFGAVTITKSITIDCTSTLGGVLAAGTNGIVINVAASDIVTLRGLSIEGAGTGLIGVSQVSDGTLHVENCRIFGFQGGVAAGIRFTPVNAGKLFVSDTNLNDNGAGTTGGGIVVRPAGPGNTKATLRRVQAGNNANGLVADGSASTGLVRVQVVDSVFSGSAGTGVIALAAGANLNTSVFLDRSEIVHNAAFGLLASGANAQIVVGGSTIADNGVGVSSTGGGRLFTYVTNNINANLSSDGTPLPSQLGGN